MTNFARDTRTKRNLYLNTVVFCLIAGVFSALLLVLLLFGGEAGSRMTTFVVTSEIGIIGVVIYAIIKVVTAERRARRETQNRMDNLIAVSTCPDYWTLSGTKCLNSYTAPVRMDGDDGTRVDYTLPGKNASINLADFDRQTLGKVCSKVREQETAWTDLQTVCGTNRL